MRITRPRLAATCALAAALTISGAPAAIASSNPPPPQGSVQFKNPTIVGNCKGVTEYQLSNYNRVVTILHEDYQFKLGEHTKAQTCHIRLKLDVPKGFRYKITNVVQRGYASILDGAKGTFVGTYGYPGRGEDLQVTKPFNAGYDDIWDVNATSGGGYSECDEKKQFVIKTTLEVKGGSQANDSFVSLDSQEANAEKEKVGNATAFQLEWDDKFCKKNGR